MSLIAELKRRNVFRVAALYVVTGWLALQMGDVLFELLGVPDWTLKFVFGVLILGFPFALFFAWAYELTPEGIKREAEVDRTQSVAPQTGRKIDRLIIGVLAVAVAVLLADRWQLRGSGSITEDAKQIIEPDPFASPGPARSIAVLPFANFSADEDWFADGLTEEILNSLARAPDLLVASRTSSFRYKDSDLPVTEIAQALGVGHVLEGSVRSAPDRIRVTAQLIRASDGFHVWSENYDRSPDDIISIQEDIALSIAAALETAMDPDALAEMMQVGTRSVAAYTSLLKAYAAQQDAIADGSYEMDQAIEFIEQAREHDPGFAQAHATAALMYRALSQSSDMRSQKAESSQAYWTRFRTAIEQAVDTARDDAAGTYYEAILADATLALDVAEQRFEAYLKARPNDMDARLEYAKVLLKRGDRERIRKALDPFVSIGYTDIRTSGVAGAYLTYAGHAGDGVALIRRELRQSPGDFGLLYQLHRALLWDGQYDEANTVLGEIRRHGGAFLATVEIRNACAQGDREAAEKALASEGESNVGGQWHAAMLLGSASRAAVVLAPLEKTDAGLDDLAGYLVYPQFDPAPFPRLMGRVAEHQVAPRPFVETIPFACPPEVAPSVAVLPFVNMSGDPDNQYFSDGVAEELLNMLVKIDGLRVPSRTSSFRFRDANQSIAEIAEQLEVKHILEGSVRKAGDQVRITAQLIDAASDEHLWSETYTRTLDDIFAIQDEIASAIVEELKVTLGSNDKLGETGTADTEAYNHYLKGRFHWHQRTGADFEIAERELRAAVAIDPNFGQAWSALADIYVLQPEYGVATSDEAIPKARAALERALTINPESAQALTTRAYLRFRHDWDYAAAEEDFRAALSIDPDYATAHQWFAELLETLRRMDEGLLHALRAYELDPLSVIKPHVVGNLYWRMGQPEKAESYFQRANELSPDSRFPKANLLRLYISQDRLDEALKLLDDLEALGADEQAGLVRMVIAAKRDDLPREEVIKALRSTPGCDPRVEPFWLAELEAYDAVLEKLGSCFESPSPFLTALNMQPVYEPMRVMPEFQAYLRRLNFDVADPD